MSAHIDLEGIKVLIEIFEKHKEEIGTFKMWNLESFVYWGKNKELIEELLEKGYGDWDDEETKEDFVIYL